MTTSSHRVDGAVAALELRGVSYRYLRGRTALKDVSLSLARGSCTALLGPNGSGKSTLLRLVSHLDRPASGSVRVLGDDNAAAMRRHLGVVFQSTALDPRLTARENLLCAARLQGLDRSVSAQRADELMARVGVTARAHEQVRSLSLGLARRVDLARALLHRPAVLLLDEPTVGLDPAARESFLLMLDELRDDGTISILAATHLVDEADRADRVILLHDGSIVADGPPTALRSRLGPRVVTVHDAPAPPEIDGLEWHRRSGAWTADLPSEGHAEQVAGALAATERAFTMAPPSLADLFAVLTGADLDDDSGPEVPDAR